MSSRKRLILLLLLLEYLKICATPQKLTQGFILQKCERCVLERQKEPSIYGWFVNSVFWEKLKCESWKGENFTCFYLFFRSTQSLFLTIAVKKYISSCKVHIRVVILMFFKSSFRRTIMVHSSLLLIKRFFFTALAQSEGWEIGYMCYI